MRHNQLQDAGRIPHREIDKRLPSLDVARTLQALLQDQKLEFIAEGNTDFDQDDNWRIMIDSSGDLVIEQRESGSWVTKATWS